MSVMAAGCQKEALAARSKNCTRPSGDLPCMTGLTMPSVSRMVFLLAYGSPVFSATGSPSISARSRRVFPPPFFRIATSPCPPTFVRMSRSEESLERRSAINRAVSSSCVDNSGFACKCLYRSSYGARSGRYLSKSAVSEERSISQYMSGPERREVD